MVHVAHEVGVRSLGLGFIRPTLFRPSPSEREPRSAVSKTQLEPVVPEILPDLDILLNCARLPGRSLGNASRTVADLFFLAEGRRTMFGVTERPLGRVEETVADDRDLQF